MKSRSAIVPVPQLNTISMGEKMSANLHSWLTLTIGFSNDQQPLTCYCQGLEGNPYLIGGCSQDINECEESRGYCYGGSTCVNTYGSYYCSNKRKFILIGVGSAFGALLLLFGTWGLYKFIKKRKDVKRKQKFFKRNGGLLLQQQISSNEGNVEKTRLFNTNELQKATGNFSIDRILGQGGQGTVYKGMLEDGKIVAIKKSKMVDEAQLSEFINEVVILSQVNHRNVVRLNLAAYFNLMMEVGNLLEIIDSQVLEDAPEEEIRAVANLAQRCLNFTGRNRPTMKEVAMELDGIQKADGASFTVHQNHGEVEHVRTEHIQHWEAVSTSTTSTFDDF
ncbi:hypothetical protein TIFTF001_047198 [Ficus carica]|uniref:Protein kinase domain-containing protein n=1 Tax=Ficus carica TaxID=3494 RepID=A0AA88CL96_FICCA|nr:hypothetical protein TIFTF001_047198 [Ficus carica]